MHHYSFPILLHPKSGHYIMLRFHLIKDVLFTNVFYMINNVSMLNVMAG